jgi:hypothetical protein
MLQTHIHASEGGARDRAILRNGEVVARMVSISEAVQVAGRLALTKTMSMDGRVLYVR